MQKLISERPARHLQVLEATASHLHTLYGDWILGKSKFHETTLIIAIDNPSGWDLTSAAIEENVYHKGVERRAKEVRPDARVVETSVTEVVTLKNSYSQEEQ